jgi:hypothetical protein
MFKIIRSPLIYGVQRKEKKPPDHKFPQRQHSRNEGQRQHAYKMRSKLITAI